MVFGVGPLGARALNLKSWLGRRQVLAIASACSCLLFASFALAAPRGVFDPSFGVGGKLIAQWGTAPADCVASGVNAVAIQRDGKILAAGVATTGSCSTPSDVGVIFRLQANGAPDPSFGSSGHVTLSAGAAKAIALTRDGRITVAGQGFVARLRSNGSLDSSFGKGGVFRAGGRNFAAMAIKHNGKIVLAGQIGPYEGHQFLVGRLTKTGKPDRSFGHRGFTTLNLAKHQRAGSDALALALASHGKIVVTGEAGDNDNGVVARFGANGRLDRSFGHKGTVIGPGGCKERI